MPDQTPAEKELDWTTIGKMLAAGAGGDLSAGGLSRSIAMASLETEGGARALAWRLVLDTALLIGKTMHELEEPFLPIIATMAAPVLSGLFGAQVDESQLRSRLRAGEGNAGAQAIMDGFIKAIVGDTPAEILPGDEGARRIAAAAVQASLESTFNAVVPEIISDIFPEGVGHFTALTELPENIIRSLGVSRLVRQALRPIVQTCCTTPATWHMNKLHRPTLLGAGTLARQIARHPEKKEQWIEDLRREGYSEERIEALLNEQAKFHSVSDVYRLTRAGAWEETAALQHLADQGYAEDVAATEFQLEKLKAIESFDRAMASAAVDAFADGRIDEGTLGGFCSGVTITAQEKAQYVELAHARRICGRRGITPSEAAAAVEAGVLSFIDYRRALERDGRDDNAVTVLELMLRAKLDKQKDAATHAAELAAERAAEKKAAHDAALQKQAAHEAALAAAARGKASDLEQAAIRGLIPIERVAEVWAQDFDAETVGILVALLEDKRAAYVAQQAARDKVAQKAEGRGVDVGALDAAVLSGVLTLDEYRRRLAQLLFSPADVELLAATLVAKMAARDDAKAAHDAAVAAGKVKHVDVATLEILVRRGHRTMADFDAALQALGFDDGARAALRERLQIQIDDDTAARIERERAEAALHAKGLSWEQTRRAVLLGLRTVDQAAAFLVTNGFTADAQQVLLSELRADLEEAEAARRRRDASPERVDAREAPIGDVARAARLGLIPIQVYLDRLTRDGWTAEAVALETDLLVTEIAQTQAARDKRDALDAAATDRGLSLDQTARAVMGHKAPIEAYTAAARLAGYSDDAAATLTALLGDELAAADAAAARRTTIAGELTARSLSLAQLEAGVLAGERSLDAYEATVRSYGYAEDDAALLAGLVARKLEIQTAAAERKGTLAADDAKRELARADYETGVVNGLRSLDDYAAWLTAAEYDAGDVELLVADAQQQQEARGSA
jgi:hypothetical protein